MGSIFGYFREKIHSRRVQFGLVPPNLNRPGTEGKKPKADLLDAGETLAKTTIEKEQIPQTLSRFGDFATTNKHLKVLKCGGVASADTLDKISLNGGSEQLRDWRECSEFYKACRNNVANVVEILLLDMELEELNRIEPNGSTALHAACYYGHTEIVKLLLTAHADRSVMNIYQCTPYDEAHSDEIKDLFERVKGSTHLISHTGAIGWILVDVELTAKATEDREHIKYTFESKEKKNELRSLFERIEKNYITQALQNAAGLEKIQDFFMQATKTQNPEYLIKAYTAETDFYSILNIQLACGSTVAKHEQGYFVALLCHHPLLNKYSYTGPAYRGMKLTDNDLRQYIIGSKLMVNSFQSTSISRIVAEAFLYRHAQLPSTAGTHLTPRQLANGKMAKNFVLCTYIIRHNRSGLHIENISEYVNEGEVLVMPYTAFTVKNLFKHVPQNSPNNERLWEIELEECEKYE
jgi:hypothetical protein